MTAGVVLPGLEHHAAGDGQDGCCRRDQAGDPATARAHLQHRSKVGVVLRAGLRLGRALGLGRDGADVLDAREHGVAQARGRGHHGVVGHQGGRLTQAGDLLLAVGALCEVPLEGCSFGVVECIDGVGTGQCVQ